MQRCTIRKFGLLHGSYPVQFVGQQTGVPHFEFESMSDYRFDFDTPYRVRWSLSSATRWQALNRQANWLHRPIVRDLAHHLHLDYLGPKFDPNLKNQPTLRDVSCVLYTVILVWLDYAFTELRLKLLFCCYFTFSVGHWTPAKTADSAYSAKMRTVTNLN